MSLLTTRPPAIYALYGSEGRHLIVVRHADVFGLIKGYVLAGIPRVYCGNDLLSAPVERMHSSSTSIEHVTSESPCLFLTSGSSMSHNRSKEGGFRARLHK